MDGSLGLPPGAATLMTAEQPNGAGDLGSPLRRLREAQKQIEIAIEQLEDRDD